MQTASPDEHHKLALPFVGRRKEAARLEELHTERKHALILGPAGVSKTSLVNHLKEKLGLLVCPLSEHLGAICESLEVGLGLDGSGLKLPQRKQRLLRALPGVKHTVVFDGVNWTTPKLSSFLECVMARVPIWICTRSEHPWDIGHFWPLLVRFARVELRRFNLHETHSLVATAVQRGIVPVEAMEIVGWLYRTSAGNPGRLCKLLKELANGHYDVRNPRSLRLLKLDYRIHDIFPADVHSGATKGANHNAR
jgi:hypothetical protein